MNQIVVVSSIEFYRCCGMTLVLYRTRALCRLRGMSIVSARSIKPSEGSRWRSRRRRVYGDCMWAEEGRG